MRLLADENVPGAVVRALIAAGADIVWVSSVAPGSRDGEVLAWAAHDQRILLTFDKDFGELARASALPAMSGVILLRLAMPAPDDIADRLADLIMARSDWAGHFSVIEPGRIRIDRLRSNRSGSFGKRAPFYRQRRCSHSH